MPAQLFIHSHAPKRRLQFVSAAIVSLSLWAGPSLAKDPFRTTNPKAIDNRTEAAFKSLFEQGDYIAADKYAQQADPSDPLTYALRASLAFIKWQGERDDSQKAAQLDQFRDDATETRETALSLVAKDPLRGNLYQAVGHFLQSAYIFSKDGTVKGTPQALGEIQQAFKYLDNAEKVDPSDPELNLLRGYIDLFVSLNLPFSSPTDAINRLDKYASPRYLAYRGLALGYRDLNQPAKALAAVDSALKATPNNPDVLYLKAQILVRQGDNRGSLAYFDKALTKRKQLPPGLIKQIDKERTRAQNRLVNAGQ
ncbi:MAG: tetratricopeptide repeat protein [Stenomitos rutilans HA7619-LM2]|jgi:tetratricopeptide (TPR) repeat protein|nr:tetratricopeptide repeat protein [Stenomitos rutilans HA7619-LM2]